MHRFGTTNLTVSALLAASIFTPSGNVIGQEKPIKTYRGSTVLVSPYNEIPEATEQCSPEEKQWWDSLRKTGNDLQTKMDKKSLTKLGVLFAEGLEKGYRVPLKDRPPQVLVPGKLVFPDLLVARARARGSKGVIELSIEYRADGSVGDITILKGLNNEMDGYAVHAARQNIFIPAVKNGVFVTDWQNARFGFSTQRN
jgi:TonB family protein